MIDKNKMLCKVFKPNCYGDVSVKSAVGELIYNTLLGISLVAFILLCRLKYMTIIYNMPVDDIITISDLYIAIIIALPIYLLGVVLVVIWNRIKDNTIAQCRREN